MKPLLLVGLLALSATVAHAQATKPQPKDNVILIQTQDSAVVALKKLAVAFVAQGYTVDKLDAQFLTLTLAPKTLPTAYTPIILAKASATPGANSKVRLDGEYRAMVMARPINGPLEIKGNEKGIPISGFRSLEKAALAYPSGQVSYGKQ